ncbi:hypothetical protein [Roseisolibacter sp. H3M3-2]|uniref:hypothetical protein n=1 Tax=Roseisolibacter sp. H3M3-2 TaxID=3031323 RepID=UPI0023D9A0B0|nr:hypothetical protein [Roseisolibacter sp. H3M3-2]MDF1506120.1 hypothetical protein [Roseisolibacter sp. H3M3-2]
MRVGGMTSAALQGITQNQARFERAAGRVAESASPAGTADVAGAVAGMAVAQYAMLASLRAAQSTNEMVADAMRNF